MSLGKVVDKMPEPAKRGMLKKIFHFFSPRGRGARNPFVDASGTLPHQPTRKAWFEYGKKLFSEPKLNPRNAPELWRTGRLDALRDSTILRNVGALGLLGGGASLASSIGKSELPEDLKADDLGIPLSDVKKDEKKDSKKIYKDDDERAADVLTYGAGGAAVGGLGSLIYGKLADKPDLKRDVISALVGGAIGAGAKAYDVYGDDKSIDKKASSIEKEALMPQYLKPVQAQIAAKKASPVLDWLKSQLKFGKGGLLASGSVAGTGLGSIGTYALTRPDEAERIEKINKSSAPLYDALKGFYKQQSRIPEGYLSEDAKSTPEADVTADAEDLTNLSSAVGAGAIGGGTAGGLGSFTYGKITGEESRKRDLIAALLGAGLGGVTGMALGKSASSIEKEAIMGKYLDAVAKSNADKKKAAEAVKEVVQIVKEKPNLWKWLGIPLASGATVGSLGTYLANRGEDEKFDEVVSRWEKHMDKTKTQPLLQETAKLKKRIDAVEEDQETNAAARAALFAGLGGVGGAGAGAAGSQIYGKVTGKEDAKRDLKAALITGLIGAAGGGAAGYATSPKRVEGEQNA